jgi:uncharacterized protein YutE (UPF0331/DUF86 family)
MSDVVAGKARNIRDCVRRIREVDPGDLATLERDLLLQESVVLNVQRACQTAIDLATHVLQLRGLGPADDSRDAFRRLEKAGLLSDDLGTRLRGMVGFRNIAVHRYQELDLRALRVILDDRIDDLLQFADLVSGLADT